MVENVVGDAGGIGRAVNEGFIGCRVVGVRELRDPAGAWPIQRWRWRNALASRLYRSTEPSLSDSGSVVAAVHRKKH